MQRIETVKIIFYFAVLFFIAKPFLGFSLVSLSHPPARSNIFIKVFNKRKLEFNEGSESDISTIQKKLADPITNLFLRFTFFLAVLFPVLFSKEAEPTVSTLRYIKLRLIPASMPYLLSGVLLI